MRELLSAGACSTHTFAWLKHARFHVEAGTDLVVSIADGRFSYGWEYLGVIDRLVYTRLTDRFVSNDCKPSVASFFECRCYLTLTQAVLNKQGGAPFGPAGTGKTETVKSLAAMLGRPCIVFNCDAAFDVTSMGRIFSGLCQTGAWGCFDEFNRLEEKVLSAVSQQIVAIQMALRSSSASHVLELNGRYIKIDPSVAIFVTMNLGYAGRAELPANLKQLFRGVAMTRPNSAAIAEITLFTKASSMSIHNASNQHVLI
jgi:dynein heavy chain 1